MDQVEVQSEQGVVSLSRGKDASLLISVSGRWRLARDVPSIELCAGHLKPRQCPKR